MLSSGLPTSSMEISRTSDSVACQAQGSGGELDRGRDHCAGGGAEEGKGEAADVLAFRQPGKRER
eukprot:119146-Chlamydomonas_euryale.AAC.1